MHESHRNSVTKLAPSELKPLRQSNSSQQIKSVTNASAPPKYKIKKKLTFPAEAMSEDEPVNEDRLNVEAPAPNTQPSIKEKKHGKTQKNFTEKPAPFQYGTNNKFQNAFVYGGKLEHQIDIKDKKNKKHKKRKNRNSKNYDTVHLNLRSTSSLTEDEKKPNQAKSPKQTSENSSLSKSKNVLGARTSLKKLTQTGSDEEGSAAKKKKK